MHTRCIALAVGFSEISSLKMNNSPSRSARVVRARQVVESEAAGRPTGSCAGLRPEGAADKDIMSGSGRPSVGGQGAVSMAVT